MVSRSVALATVAFAALLLAVPGGWSTPTSHAANHPLSLAPPGAPGRSARPVVAAPSAALGAGGPDPAVTAPGGAWSVIRPGWNMTPAPTVPVPSASGLADSAIPVETAPSLPATVPVYLNLTRDLVNCCFQQNVSMPSGTWAKIVLNMTSWIRPSVYDSSYEMYIDQVPVLFGTSPEYGTWTVIEDLTEYSALLRGVANVTFLLGAATLGGEFLTNLTLAFYPVPVGGHAPREPNAFVPLWYRAKFVPTKLAWSQSATVPADVVNATLELWAYGFGADEFWYNAAPPASPYRALTVAVDGRPIATDYPFEFINTGGIDLFMWRPVTGVQTPADRPQRFDLTADLGLLEGGHNWTLNMTGVTSGSDWIDDAVLALYTNSTVRGAHLLAYASHLGGVAQHVAGNLTEVSSASNYTVASSVLGENGTTNVTGSLTELFTMNSSTASRAIGSTTLGWSNVTGTARTEDVRSWRSDAGYGTDLDAFEVPFEIHAGTLFVQSHTTGGGYPVFGNATSYCDDVVQVWNETHAHAANGVPGGTSRLYDVLLGGNGQFTGSEELTGPNAAVLLGVNQSSIRSSVSRTFEVTTGLGAIVGTTVHVVVATASAPAPPDEAATVTTNAVSGTIALAGATATTWADVGREVNISVQVLGGVGPFSYAWSGLPYGCAPVNAPAISCSPAVRANYSVALRVDDSAGDTANGTVTELVVAADPSVRVSADPREVDVGGSVNFTAVISGGVGPFRCTWSVNGGAVGSAEDCAAPLAWTTSGSGARGLGVTVALRDSAGAVNVSPVFDLALAPPVSASVVASGHSGATALSAVSGSSVELVANISGGVAPFTVTWYNDSGEVGQGATFNLTAGAVGTTEGVYLAVADSGGGTNESATFVITSVAATPGHSGSNSSGSGLPLTLLLLAAGIGAAFLVAVAVLVRRRPGRPR